MAVVTNTDIAPVAASAPRIAFRYLEWGPVILGALAAVAISVVLLTFGAALGLTVVSPHPYAGLSAKAVLILTAVYIAIVHVASFGAGGYLAGRTRSPWVEGNSVEQHFRDGSHGFAVWAIGIVVGAALAVSGVTGIVNAAAKSATAIAAAGTAGAASNPALGQAAVNQLSSTDYAVDRLLAPAPGAAAAPDGAGRVTRADVAAPMARTLAANLAARNDSVDAKDRTYLAQLISQQTGLPQAEAEKRVDEAYAQLKTAEQKVRDAADQARKATLIAAFLAAATLAIGCAAACAGAALGARHRDENTLIVLFGSRRFW
ncbi:hypothetical protein [Reyranella sp.]|uniref:hypothetical protein n=1 Tax=Reyranella sp. TaxID=1929291 RepID=UPI003BAA4F17